MIRLIVLSLILLSELACIRQASRSGLQAQAESCLAINADAYTQEYVQARVECKQAIRDKLMDCKHKLTKTYTDKNNLLVKAINDKGEPIRSTLFRDQARQANMLAETKRINQAYKSRFDAVVKEFNPMLVQYERQYHGQGEALRQRFAAITAQVNQADQITLIRQMQEIREIEAEEARLRGQYVIASRLLEHKFDFIESSYHVEIEPVAAKYPELTVPAYTESFKTVHASLRDVRAYAEQRSGEVSAAAGIMTGQITQRLDQLIKIAVAKETLPTIREAAHLSAVAGFMAQVNSAVKAAFQTDDKDPKLDLSYYGKRWDALQAFNMLILKCKSPESWQQSGCLRVTQYQTVYESQIKVDIRDGMRFGLMILAQRENARNDLIESATKDIDTGKIGDAVVKYDAILAQAGAQ